MSAQETPARAWNAGTAACCPIVPAPKPCPVCGQLNPDGRYHCRMCRELTWRVALADGDPVVVSQPGSRDIPGVVLSSTWRVVMVKTKSCIFRFWRLSGKTNALANPRRILKPEDAR